MKKRRKNRSRILIVIGMLLIVLAGILYHNNLLEDRNAANASEAILKDLHAGNASEAGVYGTLQISKLNLQLPVLSEWSEEGLKQAPCKYTGSAETGDLIIAAHNFDSHFGRLESLSYGDRIEFTDRYGDRYVYTVKEVEILEDTEVSKLQAGAWKLTLFTCTISTEARVTVRCEFENE